jgi:integrase
VKRALLSLTAVRALLSLGVRGARASLLIAAGVNVKAISAHMGHASVSFTLDRYGHLLPGSEAETITKLDALLAGPEAGPRALETAQ